MPDCTCDVSEEKCAKNICERARKLWLLTSGKGCSSGSDMMQVESLYQTVAGCVVCEQVAQEKVALLMLQSGRSAEADPLLRKLGYTCRLAEPILNYNINITLPPYNETTTTSATNVAAENVAIYDKFLTEAELSMLRTVFLDPNASYWTSNSYSVEPPSPYFSHVMQLQQDGDTTAIANLVRRLQAFLVPQFGSTLNTATCVELWAHNRPVATGHQFHFDSDNEGCTAVIRNPIVSCVLYLTPGAPVTVTNQRLATKSLASVRGYTCPAHPNRLVAFEGKLLHGVIPGKANTSVASAPTESTTTNVNPTNNRVSVMFAFWKRIRVRESGAAMPFPTGADWAQPLVSMMNPTAAIPAAANGSTTRRVHPIQQSHVYASVETGQPWARKMGMPGYDQIFQGF